MGFENLIEFTNMLYMKQGKATVVKIPTNFLPLRDNNGRIFSCKVEKKSCVDYIGRYGIYPIAIEAKHTSDDRIDLRQVEDHQAEFMDKWNNENDAIGIVLVSFKLQEFYAVPWQWWTRARKLWMDTIRKGKRKAPETEILYISGDEGREKSWIYKGKGSLSPEDMDPIWRIEYTGANGLPYLETVKQIFNL
jgi:recombination protein U